MIIIIYLTKYVLGTGHAIQNFLLQLLHVIITKFNIQGKSFSPKPYVPFLMVPVDTYFYTVSLFQLITGEYKAFESIRGLYSSWFDLLGGWVMFTAPWSRRHELGAAANACAGMAPERTKLDDMVRALLEGDLHQVCAITQEMVVKTKHLKFNIRRPFCMFVILGFD